MPSRLETMGYTLGGAELSGAEEGGDSDGLAGTQNELMGTGSFDEDSHNRSKSWNQVGAVVCRVRAGGLAYPSPLPPLALAV